MQALVQRYEPLVHLLETSGAQGPARVQVDRQPTRWTWSTQLPGQRVQTRAAWCREAWHALALAPSLPTPRRPPLRPLAGDLRLPRPPGGVVAVDGDLVRPLDAMGDIARLIRSCGDAGYFAATWV